MERLSVASRASRHVVLRGSGTHRVVTGICAPGDLCTLALCSRFQTVDSMLQTSCRVHISPAMMQGVTGICAPGDLCTLVLSSPSQTVTTFQAIDITEYSSLGVVL